MAQLHPLHGLLLCCVQSRKSTLWAVSRLYVQQLKVDRLTIGKGRCFLRGHTGASIMAVTIRPASVKWYLQARHRKKSDHEFGGLAGEAYWYSYI